MNAAHSATVLLVTAALVAVGAAMQPGSEAQIGEATYTNPVGGDILMGDPFVLRHGGVYYLYGTTWPFKAWRSRDLVHWRPLGAVYRWGDDSWGRRSFWAPEVFAYRGRFYMAFSSARDPEEGFRLCLAVADAPEGPFREMHAPWCDVGWSCIDAHVFLDDGAVPYLYFARVGVLEPPEQNLTERLLLARIYGVRLKADLSAPVGNPFLFL